MKKARTRGWAAFRRQRKMNMGNGSAVAIYHAFNPNPNPIAGPPGYCRSRQE